jgi:hypothetical protein
MEKTNWNYDLIYNIRAVAKTSVEIQRHHYLTPHIAQALRNLDRRLLLKDSRRHQNKDPHHEWSPEPPPQRTTRWVTTLPTPYPTYEGRPVPRSPPSSTTSEVSETASTIVPPNCHRQSSETADTVEEQWYWDTVEDKKEARQRYLALGSETPKNKLTLRPAIVLRRLTEKFIEDQTRSSFPHSRYPFCRTKDCMVPNCKRPGTPQPRVAKAQATLRIARWAAYLEEEEDENQALYQPDFWTSVPTTREKRSNKPDSPHQKRVKYESHCLNPRNKSGRPHQAHRKRVRNEKNKAKKQGRGRW